MSETVHAVTNVCLKHIHKVLYDISGDLLHWITSKCQIKVIDFQFTL